MRKPNKNMNATPYCHKLPLSSASAAPLPHEVTDQLHDKAGQWWEEVTGGAAKVGAGVLLLGAGVLALAWAASE